jgi:hypothetical protein
MAEITYGLGIIAYSLIIWHKVAEIKERHSTQKKNDADENAGKKEPS